MEGGSIVGSAEAGIEVAIFCRSCISDWRNSSSIWNLNSLLARRNSPTRRPSCLAISGNFFGPKIIRANTKINMLSARLIPPHHTQPGISKQTQIRMEGYCVSSSIQRTCRADTRKRSTGDGRRITIWLRTIVSSELRSRRRQANVATTPWFGRSGARYLSGAQ